MARIISIRERKRKPVRAYEEILNDLNNTDQYDYRKIRELHRELKHYHDGVPFLDRYDISATRIMLDTLALGTLIVIALLIAKLL